jgi:hypothetical protein
MQRQTKKEDRALLVAFLFFLVLASAYFAFIWIPLALSIDWGLDAGLPVVTQVGGVLMLFVALWPLALFGGILTGCTYQATLYWLRRRSASPTH